jgi:hypothetical protein
MSANAWQIIRAGATDDGVHQLRAEYLERPDASRAIELGAALLWVRNYQAAWEVFHEARRHERWTNSTYFGMAGVAKWCLNDEGEAIEEWRAGLEAQYSDSAGGVTLPLLLFVASIVNPALFPQGEAKKLLTAKANDRRVVNWPGPIAEFLLGRIDNSGLRKKCVGMDDSDTVVRHWRANFYQGVLEYAGGNATRFKELMRETAMTSDDDFDSSNKLFLVKLWHEEFFIARHEAVERPPSSV